LKSIKTDSLLKNPYAEENMKAIKNKRNCSYNANNGTFTTVYEWRLTPKGLVLIDTWWKRLIYFNY